MRELYEIKNELETMKTSLSELKEFLWLYKLK